MVAYCFFFNDTATTEIYTLSLHDALPIWRGPSPCRGSRSRQTLRGSRGLPATRARGLSRPRAGSARPSRSEEHTSELQSRQYLVCRLLLEKKKTKPYNYHTLIRNYVTPYL